MYRIAIVTLSDKCSRGESGNVIASKFSGIAEVRSYVIIPGERELISAELCRLCDDDPVDVILTTGGTGFGPRDVTPEATLNVVERLAPGLPETMRANSLKIWYTLGNCLRPCCHYFRFYVSNQR